VPEQKSGAPCPPHHWLVTTRRRGGVTVEHHRCPRCGAEKDVPWTVATAGNWRRFAPRGTPRP
jgi:hypothetical protein